MKPKLLFGGIFLLLSSYCVSQSSAVRVSTNFLITQEPVFQIAFEQMPDSSAWTWSLSADGGRFQRTEKEMFFSSIDNYSVTGFGVMPEARYYISHSKSGEHFGFFGTGFAHFHRFKAIQQEGVTFENGALVVSDPNIALSRFNDLKYGIGGGYRSACVASRLHLEVVTGWHFGHLVFSKKGHVEPNRDSRGSAADQLRFELNLVALF